MAKMSDKMLEEILAVCYSNRMQSPVVNEKGELCRVGKREVYRDNRNKIIAIGSISVYYDRNGRMIEIDAAPVFYSKLDQKMFEILSQRIEYDAKGNVIKVGKQDKFIKAHYIR